jgi:hypothetical protein
MCYNKVNETEVEFDFYLALAGLYDQGYPTLEHSSPVSPSQEDKKESISPPPEESGEDEVCST